MTRDQQPARRGGAPGVSHAKRPPNDVFRRRRRVVAVGAGVLVVAVAVLTAFVWPGFALPEPDPAPTVTVTAPPPTPSISPAERTGEQTALTQALPDTVLQFAWADVANLAQWQEEHQAIESWSVTYADAEGADAVRIVLEVGQWADDAAATAFAEAQVKAAGEPTKDGDVLVDGETVGTYALIPDGDEAALWWRNGTVVFRAQGPADQVEAFYQDFPL